MSRDTLTEYMRCHALHYMLLAVMTLKIAGPDYGFSLYDYGSFTICFKQNLGTFWGLRRLFVTRPVSRDTLTEYMRCHALHYRR